MEDGLTRNLAFVGCCLLASTIAASGAFASDANAKLFKNHCGACHTIAQNGGKRQGPNLWGILDREIGSVDGFAYSKGLKTATSKWTSAQLDKWLENPKQVFSDTYMNYRQAKPEVRTQIIQYVEKASRQ